MKKALFIASVLPGLLAGTGALAGDPPQAYFSGALSYDSPTLPDRTADGPLGLTVGGISLDLYKHDIGPLGLSVGTGFAPGEQASDPGAYMVGLRFDYGGLSVASQIRDGNADACGLAQGGCDAGPAWNVGASYSAGAASLSAQYQAVNPWGADGQTSVGDVFRLGLDYQIFDGFSSRADAYFIDGGQGLAGDESAVVLIGTRITF
ncbi:porin [Hwanghaeella sp.]|uniref:porin n=1 Tax=Hwanghaeella sp. TaxID=2605943 RepID=UPI003CCBD6F0